MYLRLGLHFKRVSGVPSWQAGDASARPLRPSFMFPALYPALNGAAPFEYPLPGIPDVACGLS